VKYFFVWFSILKEDIKVFQLAFGPGVGKYFYFPAFRSILIFRLSQLFYRCVFTRPLAYILTNLNDFFHGIWIGPRVKIGKGLSLPHPRGVIINPDTVIGDYCSMLHEVTFGGAHIVVGDNVEIMAGVKIINDKLKNRSLNIGNEAVLGAGTIVLDDVPNSAVVVGIPGRIVKYREHGDTWLNWRIRNADIKE